MEANQQFMHLQAFFSDDYSSKFPSLQFSDATAPVFVRGRRYATYAAKREATIKQRRASIMQSPVPPAKKKVSFDHDCVLRRVDNEAMRASVSDFSVLRKENKKPLEGSPLPPPSFRTPPKSPGIRPATRNNAGVVGSGRKEVGLVRRSHASLKDLNGFSPSRQSFVGGRVRMSGIGLGNY